MRCVLVEESRRQSSEVPLLQNYKQYHHSFAMARFEPQRRFQKGAYSGSRNRVFLLLLGLCGLASLAICRFLNPASVQCVSFLSNSNTGVSMEQRLARKSSDGSAQCSLLPRVVESGFWFSDIKGDASPDFTLLSAWLKPEYGSGMISPSEIPEMYRDGFTMNGQIEVKSWYLNQAYLGKAARTPVWSKELVEEKIEMAKNKDATSYEEDGKRLIVAMEKYKMQIQGKRGLVVGSERPWVEGALLNTGADKVLTLEFGSIDCQHPQVDTILPTKFTEKFLNGEVVPYDVGVSFSSLEHDGLGRYGDVLNPIGDLQSMAKMLTVIKPGGLFFLAMPTLEGTDKLAFNAHRYYGKLRLPKLFAGWTLIDVISANPTGPEQQPVWVLQNMNGCSL